MSFRNEYEYLIHLINCAFSDSTPEELPDGLSFEKVYRYGKIHEVGNIAFLSLQKLKNQPSEELLRKWKTFYAFSVQRNAHQMVARTVIVNALNSAGIRNVEVQGTIMKQLYPSPEWRMMTDIDIIIDKDNIEKTARLMKNMGYEITELGDFEVDLYGPNDVFIEIHSDFFDPFSLGYGAITDVFDSSVPSGDGLSYTASDTIVYLYNLLHCIKHYKKKGIGIRRIMDMYVLKEQMYDKIDTAYVDEALRKNGFDTAADELFALAYEWFGGKKSDKNLDEMKKLVYMSGNHGTVEVLVKNEYREKKTSNKFIFRVKKALSLIFLKKEIIYAAYPYCREHRLPVVLCWIYRAFYVLFRKDKRGNAVKVLSTINKTDVK